jgi:hypothetical protein
MIYERDEGSKNISTIDSIERSHPAEDGTPPKEGDLKKVGADLCVCPIAHRFR